MVNASMVPKEYEWLAIVMDAPLRRTFSRTTNIVNTTVVAVRLSFPLESLMNSFM
jgi:hypothetical protein